MSQYSAHLINTFDSSAMNWGWESDQGSGPQVDVSEKNYMDSKNELTEYIESLESRVTVPVGFKLVPFEPTEEMIQAACIAQSSVKFDTYTEWAGSLSNGVVEMIRKFEISSYRSMVAAHK